MNEQQQLIKDTLVRLLTDLCTKDVIDAAEAGEWPKTLWDTLTETGLTLAGIPESCNGSGGDPEDSLLVIWEAAKFAAPVPLAEHFIAASLLAEAGASASSDPMSVALGEFSIDADGNLEGTAKAVPYGSCSSEIISVAAGPAGPQLVRIPVSACELSATVNLAGEPRNDLSVNCQLEADQVLPATDDVSERITLMAAACRSLMMAGALESILEMSVQYSLERTQFGRPISKFQAIQQQLATLAGDVAASTMAAHAVVGSFRTLDSVDIAIAKSRIGEAVAVCTDIAHQVHGAMGYTLEHALNHRSRRLWSWRDEYGSEPEWQRRVGEAFLAGGADQLWQAVTERR